MPWAEIQRQRVINIPMHFDAGSYMVVLELIGWNLQLHPLKAHTIVIADLTLMVLAQHIG